MERLTIADFDDWLLSLKPIVRFQGRDFEQTPEEYVEWVRGICATVSLGVVTSPVADPPGVVVQTYTKGEPPVLTDPLLKVGKTDYPWLYCVGQKCRVRVPSPGMSCPAHV